MVSNEEKAAAAAASASISAKKNDRDVGSCSLTASSSAAATPASAPTGLPAAAAAAAASASSAMAISNNPSSRFSPRVSPRVSPGAPVALAAPMLLPVAAVDPAVTVKPKSVYCEKKSSEFVFKVPREAPVFVPTLEEFKNPLTYINKIRPQAEKFGICKIKPPSTWVPTFQKQLDLMRFTPRVQRLNELEAKTRIKLNFLDQIAKFWDLQNSSLRIPMVERKSLDLYSLHRLVQEEGGLEQVTRDRKWSKIASRLGYPSGKSAGTIIKGHYERILFPFDRHTLGESDDKDKNKEKLESECSDHDYKPHGIVSRQKVVPPREPTARRSQRIDAATTEACAAEEKRIKEEKDAESATARGAELRRMKFYNSGGLKTLGLKAIKPENGAAPGPKSRMNGGGNSGGASSGGSAIAGATRRGGSQRRSNLDPLAKYICHICNRGDVEEAMLLCDGCDDSYHTFCLLPPLLEIPKGEWRCPKCVVEEVSKPTEAFGFEQARVEYTLKEFGRMADRFKSDYFNVPMNLVPTETVEREFWRLVSSVEEDVTVEYGADLHTMEHGSGFPKKSLDGVYKKEDDRPYAESNWNLNNLPHLQESVLGHINANISGMKVPWMYVGMCFATFCWHNEDHWSYSINYLHWGEPKTWYGVPGSKAEAFEKTMKRAAPELFQSQPDLLHQLVTIMNPNILMSEGVPVYRTDQHAGEFVITFPRAYHAGFNQGYNFAEAVNFAPADWMKIGRECVNHYAMLHRYCVFSHDELVCKMAFDPDKLNLGIATACYLDMAEMVDSEKKLRKSLLEWGVTRAEREAFELIPDEERQCEQCKTTLFLSAVTCGCTLLRVCLRHYTELCKCSPDKHTLKYRYTLDELPLMLRKLKVKAESFEKWLAKVRDVIDPNQPTVTTLDELQELALEADDKKFPGSVLLDRLNSAVLEAEKCVTVIQQLDINKMRTRTRNSCDFAKYKLTLEELELFVQEIDNLCCIIPEGNSVRELQQMGTDFVEQCHALLKHDLVDIDEDDVKKLLDEGSSLCIELPQLQSLKNLSDQLHWYNDVRELRESGDKMPLATMKRMLDRGLALVPHATLEKELADLQSIMISVEMWEASASLCFQNDTQHELRDVEHLLAEADNIEGNLPSQPTLRDALRKAKEWLASVDQLQKNENYPYLHTIEAVIHRARNVPFQLTEMRRMEDHVVTAVEWKEHVGRTFLRKNAHFSLLDALSPRPDAVMLADSYPRQMTDAEYVAQFSEEMGPVQVVMAFKNAEDKEVLEMKTLRTVNAAKCPESDRFCFCRRRFYGRMYNCQLCQDWFHEECVPAPRHRKRSRPAAPAAADGGGAGICDDGASPKAQPQDNLPSVPTLTERERDRDPKFLCPSCMRSRRPRLDTILKLLMSLQRLPIRLPEGEALQCLTERAMHWQERAKKALLRPEIVSKVDTLSEIAKQQLARASRGKEGRSAPPKKVMRARRVSESSDSSVDMDEVAASANATDKNYSDADSTTTTADISGIITLTDATRTLLVELLMEGDLLEVWMDEAQHLWRILNASKPSSTDLTLINSRYNIMPHPTEDLVNTSKPHHDDDATTAGGAASQNATAAVTPASVPARKSGKLSRSAASGAEQTQSPLTPHNNGGSAASAATLNTGSAGSAANTSAGGGGGGSNQKLKRGRKLKMSTATEKTGGGSSAASAASAQKKKRGRKSVPDNQNQTPTAPSTSDEEEECSATNCVRPAGREVDWVQCDGGCNKWYHMYCVGLVKNQIKPDDDYVCRKCKKQSNTAEASSATAPTATPAAAAASGSGTANTSNTSASNAQSASTANTAATAPSAASKAKQRFEEDFPDDDGDDDDVDDDEDDEDDDEEDDDGVGAGRKSSATAVTTTTATTTTTSAASTSLTGVSSTTTNSNSTSNTPVHASGNLKTKATSEPGPPSSSKKPKL